MSLIRCWIHKTDLPMHPTKAGRVYKPYEGSISVEDKKEVLRKYDELKLKELTLDKAAEQGCLTYDVCRSCCGKLEE